MIDLTVRDAAKLLGVAEKTIYRWLAAGTIPHRRIGTQYRFDRAELAAWAAGSGQPFEATVGGEAEAGGRLPSLCEVLEVGGVHYEIDGRTPTAVTQKVLEVMPLPAAVDRAYLFQALTARETLGSTGVGEGIAIPHTRFPLAPLPEPQLTVAFTQQPVPWNAVDGLPVSIVLVPLNRTMRGHLHLLSRLAFVLRDPEWRRLLDARESPEQILAGLAAAEARLRRPQAPNSTTAGS